MISKSNNQIEKDRGCMPDDIGGLPMMVSDVVV
jgi:hypothetical protein